MLRITHLCASWTNHRNQENKIKIRGVSKREQQHMGSMKGKEKTGGGFPGLGERKGNKEGKGERQ